MPMDQNSYSKAYTSGDINISSAGATALNVTGSVSKLRFHKEPQRSREENTSVFYRRWGQKAESQQRADACGHSAALIIQRAGWPEETRHRDK